MSRITFHASLKEILVIYLRNQVKLYVLLFEGRTGSTFLTETLAQHPDVLAEVEQLRALTKAGQGAAEQLAWAKEFLTPPLAGPHKVRGFKTKLRDVLDPAALAGLLREKQVLVIHMQRRNRIKKALSYFTGRQLSQTTNNWNLYDAAKRPGAFVLDVAEFDAALQEREEWDHNLDAYVQSLHQPTLSLYYEDMLLDQQAFLETVYRFLDVAYRPVRATSLKNTSDDLRQVLLNFDELRTHYAGTPYEAMFDEVLVRDA